MAVFLSEWWVGRGRFVTAQHLGGVMSHLQSAGNRVAIGICIFRAS